MAGYNAPSGDPTVKFPATRQRLSLNGPLAEDPFVATASLGMIKWVKTIRCTNCDANFSAAEPPLSMPCGHLVCKECSSKCVQGCSSDTVKSQCKSCGTVTYPRRPNADACVPHRVLEQIYVALESVGCRCATCGNLHAHFNSLFCVMCGEVSCLAHCVTQHPDHPLRLIDEPERQETAHGTSALWSLHQKDVADVGAALTQCASCGILLTTNPRLTMKRGQHQLPCSHYVHRACISNGSAACTYCLKQHHNVLLDPSRPPFFLAEAIAEMTPSHQCRRCKKKFHRDFILTSSDLICLYCEIEERSRTTG